MVPLTGSGELRRITLSLAILLLGGSLAGCDSRAGCLDPTECFAPVKLVNDLQSPVVVADCVVDSCEKTTDPQPVQVGQAKLVNVSTAKGISGHFLITSNAGGRSCLTVTLDSSSTGATVMLSQAKPC